jgi:hypothetical protein
VTDIPATTEPLQFVAEVTRHGLGAEEFDEEGTKRPRFARSQVGAKP